MADERLPPFYVLLAHSPLSNVPTGALSNTLAHPTIQYHYADDSPLEILPRHPNENVLVFNYDSKSTQPTVQSVSHSLVVTDLKIEEAPGAAADDSKVQRNTSMFIIETTTNDSITLTSHADRKSPQATLAQFKYRNRILRRVLQYPTTNTNHMHMDDARLVDSPQTMVQSPVDP